MYSRMNSQNTPNAISSLASADGVSPSSSPDGQSADQLEPARAPANPSPSLEPEKEISTSATSGQHSSGLSVIAARLASDGLTQSLASRLKARLPMAGLMKFRQTWKEKATPSGRRYWAHTASVPRTAGNGFIGWP